MCKISLFVFHLKFTQIRQGCNKGRRGVYMNSFPSIVQLAYLNICYQKLKSKHYVKSLVITNLRKPNKLKEMSLKV